MGKLENIATRHAKRAPMIESRKILITLEGGLAGDSRGKLGKRQVTVLAREAWDRALTGLTPPIPWTARRANLLVSDLDLADSLGQTLTIGPIVLEITGETAPCERMDEACPGLKEALEPEWRGGVTCRVVRGGSIQIGDEAKLTSAGQSS